MRRRATTTEVFDATGTKGKHEMDMRKGGMTVISVFVVAMLLPAASIAQWKTRWEYEGLKGPAHWAELDPEYAACNGKQQSPVDISNAQKLDLPALRFESQSRPLKGLVNNGYTIRVNYHDAPGNGDFLWVGNERYQLTQFHFHRPSEETIDGKASAMVAHLMYQSGDGKVIGVAVLLKAGRPNSTIQQIWDHMPMTESKVRADFSHEDEEVAAVKINPAGLLPETFGYYTYMGSVTAPPCTEGVSWYVLKTPVDMSVAQIKAFAKLYPRDVRAVQPLNGRIVKESQ
jgi:carbonic anhydrase